jgi:hypothetical protein
VCGQGRIAEPPPLGDIQQHESRQQRFLLVVFDTVQERADVGSLIG